MKLNETEWDQLEMWINDVFLDLIEQTHSNRLRWCPNWWEHPEMVARLWTLYLGWTQVINDGSALDFSLWILDHLDRHCERLFRADGPASACNQFERGHTPPRERTIFAKRPKPESRLAVVRDAK
jgi:hypothetical protein